MYARNVEGEVEKGGPWGKELWVDLFVGDWVHVVVYEGLAARRCEEVVWELVTLDNQTDGFALFAFEVDHFVSLAAHIGWVEETMSGDSEQSDADD